MQENIAGTPAPNGSYNSELKPDLRKPRDVLRDMMIFYDTQAKDIIADIILRLKDDMSRGTGSELAMMYKKFSEAADIAIRCAEKLAPYEHPKLESIEVKKELTHRFVVRAPAPTIDTKAWVVKAQEEQKLLSSKPGHDLIELTEKPVVTFEQAVSDPRKPASPNIIEPDDDDMDEYIYPDYIPDDEDTEE